jgi:hypothetical protein
MCMRTAILAPAAVVVVTLAACGGGSGGDDGDDTGDDGVDADPGPSDPQFDDTANGVSIYESWAYGTTRTYVDAWFPTEAVSQYTEAARVGNCRLLTSDAAVCGDCSGWCNGDVCHEWPTYREAGRITTSGLATTVTLDWETGYYGISPWPLPDDLFGAGDAIEVTAAGGELAGFTVTATGVAAIEADLDGECDNEWRVTRGQDAVLHWDRVTGSRVHLWVPSPNNGHGLPSNAVIECEGPDTGELTVAAALIDEMPGFIEVDACDGVSCVGIDCPPATLSRYAAGTATAAGEPVELRVESRVTFIVRE